MISGFFPCNWFISLRMQSFSFLFIGLFMAIITCTMAYPALVVNSVRYAQAEPDSLNVVDSIQNDPSEGMEAYQQKELEKQERILEMEMELLKEQHRQMRNKSLFVFSIVGGIGLLILGGAGFLIWYLINQSKREKKMKNPY